MWRRFGCCDGYHYCRHNAKSYADSDASAKRNANARCDAGTECNAGRGSSIHSYPNICLQISWLIRQNGMCV